MWWPRAIGIATARLAHQEAMEVSRELFVSHLMRGLVYYAAVVMQIEIWHQPDIATLRIPTPSETVVLSPPNTVA
jgi:hypothetical protein